MSGDKETLSFAAPGWMSEGLRALAFGRGMTVEELLRRLALDHLEQHAPQAVPPIFARGDIADPCSPMVQMANALLAEAIDHAAAEMRFVPDPPDRLLVQHRVHDQWTNGATLPQHLAPLLVARYEEMAAAFGDVPPDSGHVAAGRFLVTKDGARYGIFLARPAATLAGKDVTLRIVRAADPVIPAETRVERCGYI